MVNSMDLHTRTEKPDWELVKPEEWNSWQWLASKSGGILSPSNIISAAGLILVICGLFQVSYMNYATGALLIALGRTFDILDGLVAELTKTKSRLGEAVDSSVDKAEIFVALIAITISGLLPTAVIVATVAISLLLTLSAFIAAYRDVALHPTLSGKLATAAVWTSLVLFILENALRQNNGLVVLAAYIFFGLFVCLGLFAVFKYVRTALGKEPSYKKLLSRFDNFLLVQNPKSSNAGRAKNTVNKFQKLTSIKLDIIKTSSNYSQNEKDIEKYLIDTDGKTLLLIGGGDGTVHDVVNILMSKSLRKLSNKVVVLPLWGGNANDFAYMLNGLSLGKKLAKILGRGKIHELFPLKITIGKNKKSVTRYAMCYASFGASAFIAQHFNVKPVHRGKPLQYPPALIVLQEIWGIAGALKRAKPFGVEINGESISIFDEVFVNGSRLSKMNTMPVKLNDRAYYHARANDKHPLFSKRVARAIAGRKIGQITSNPTSFTLQEDALAQFDGEVLEVSKGFKINVSLASRPIQALSIKLSDYLVGVKGLDLSAREISVSRGQARKT